MTYLKDRLSWEAEITIVVEGLPDQTMVLAWTPEQARQLLDRHPGQYRVRMRRVGKWLDYA